MIQVELAPAEVEEITSAFCYSSDLQTMERVSAILNKLNVKNNIVFDEYNDNLYRIEHVYTNNNQGVS